MKLLKGLGDRRSAEASTSKPDDIVREIVAGRAVHRPIVPQRFVAGQDLFDDEIDGAAILRQRNSERLRRTSLQAFRNIRSANRGRPGDRCARRVTAPLADQLEEQPMRRVENLRQFHPDRGEIVDVEETPVIDFLRRHPPESEPVGLIVQELIERVETARIARRAVDLRDRFLDRLLHLRRFLAAPLQPALDDFLFARAFRDAFRIGFGPPGQIFQRGQMLWNSA